MEVKKCGLCSVELTSDNTALRYDGEKSFDSRGYEWCKNCTHEFDSIDWEEVYNK